MPPNRGIQVGDRVRLEVLKIGGDSYVKTNLKVVEINHQPFPWASLQTLDNGVWYSAGSAPVSHLLPEYEGGKRKTRRNRKSRRN
jgi:hypothetical protein